LSVLFVTNGHGEAAIAARIARELRAFGHEAVHFPLVGSGFEAVDFPEVGPRAALPSGGLVAMGNLGNLVRDVRAGFLSLLKRQLAFLRGSAGRHAVVVAVGDVYALALAYRARTPTVFVGTAKSEYVTPYGWIERCFMRHAALLFVRDDPTVAALRANGLRASTANVIVDLASDVQPYRWPPAQARLVLLPGSREDAYADAALLMEVVQNVARARCVYAMLSVAPSLDASRLAASFAAHGWQIAPGSQTEPFVASIEGKAVVTAWRGDFAALFGEATLALGQAGTANEAAAACGLPVVALETRRSGREGWYRMRQARLLGAALEVLPGDPVTAASSVVELLDDAARRGEMGATGRARMGAPGGAALVAGAIAARAEASRA